MPYNDKVIRELDEIMRGQRSKYAPDSGKQWTRQQEYNKRLDEIEKLKDMLGGWKQQKNKFIKQKNTFAIQALKKMARQSVGEFFEFVRAFSAECLVKNEDGTWKQDDYGFQTVHRFNIGDRLMLVEVSMDRDRDLDIYTFLAGETTIHVRGEGIFGAVQQVNIS